MHDLGTLRVSKSPIRDPNSFRNVGSIPSVNESTTSGLDEFNFGPPTNINGLDMNIDGMFLLSNKRKASVSPDSKDLTKKNKSAAKKERKNRLKLELKSKSVVDISPSKV